MRPLSLTKLCLMGIAISLLSACQKQAQTSTHTIPEPSEMMVDIDVNGRVSTLKHIDIKHVGKQIPYTYSDGKIANSPSYEWWVSKHFAIKSDLPFAKVKLYLELLEMSYPHYVELFGKQPPNIERQRIAVVYGSSRAKVKDAMFDDGFLRGVHEHAGGETMYYNRAGYSFPSHREQHQRYIVIHETMHAFHMALNGHSTWAPYWITEGLADSIAHHVYDSKKNQLTVMVFDRAPMNYVVTGLKQYQELEKPSMAEINAHPSLKRGLNFLMIHYLLSTAESNHRFKLFIDKLMTANPHSDQTVPVTNHILKDVYHNWQELEAGFTQFVAETQSSFEIINGPWEQDGNQYWIRQYDHKKTAQLNIAISPANKPAPHVRRYDFPAPASPSDLQLTSPLDVGFVIDYLPEHVDRGSNGIGFRFEDPLPSFAISISEGRILEVKNGFDGDRNQAYLLNDSLVSAIDASRSLNVAISFLEEHMKIQLTTRSKSQTVLVELEQAQIQKLTSSSLSLLAKNNNNRITPFFQENRAPQLTRNVVGSNVFGLKHSEKLIAIMANCKRSKCQQRLKQIYKLVDSDNNTEADRLISTLYESQYWSEDLDDTVSSPLVASIEYHRRKPFVRINNALQTLAARIEVFYYSENNDPVGNETIEADLARGVNNIDITPIKTARFVKAKVKLENRNYRPFESTTAPITNFDGVEMRLEQRNGKYFVTLSGPYSGPTKGDLTVRALGSSHKHLDLGNKQVVIEPYQSVHYDFKLPKDSQLNSSFNFSLNFSLIEATAILNVDGEDVKVTQTLKI